MVDQEVTDILEEIRIRVRASEVVPGTVTTPTSNGDRGETAPETGFMDQAPNKRDYANVAVMARAWDRLPPLVSNRSGVTARLELWIKSKLKAALRWFTWEQVNFNAATHRTFLELIESVNACEQQLIQLKHQLNAESSAIREQFGVQQREIESERAALLQTQLQTQRDLSTLSDLSKRQQVSVDSQQLELNKQRAALNSQQAELNARVAEFNSQIDDLHSQLGQKIDEQDSKFATAVREFRERDERLLDEQRVCFRQLSLEVSESQILQDRVRRELESRISKLEPPKPK